VPDLSWARSSVASAVRQVILSCVLGPIIDLYTPGGSSGANN
jgi:hypothetical protein